MWEYSLNYLVRSFFLYLFLFISKAVNNIRKWNSSVCVFVSHDLVSYIEICIKFILQIFLYIFSLWFIFSINFFQLNIFFKNTNKLSHFLNFFLKFSHIYSSLLLYFSSKQPYKYYLVLQRTAEKFYKLCRNVNWKLEYKKKLRQFYKFCLEWISHNKTMKSQQFD